MKVKNRGIQDPNICHNTDEVPSCDVGPLGRLSWAIRELYSIIKQKKKIS